MGVDFKRWCCLAVTPILIGLCSESAISQSTSARLPFNAMHNTVVYPPRARTRPPFNAIPLKAVILPRALDPTGQVRHVRSGTAVYVLKNPLISWPTIVRGRTVQNVIAGFNVQSMRHLGPNTIIKLVDGKQYIVPTTAITSPGMERDIGFVAPGARIPLILRGRAPDFIVP